MNLSEVPGGKSFKFTYSGGISGLVKLSKQ